MGGSAFTVGDDPYGPISMGAAASSGSALTYAKTTFVMHCSAYQVMSVKGLTVHSR